MKNKSYKDIFICGKTYVVLPHIYPDGDTIGSSVSIYNYLNTISNDVYLVLNDPFPENLEFLDNGKFISLNDFEELKINNYIVVAIDSSDLTRVEDRMSIVEKAKSVFNIDHHITNENYGDVNVVDVDASATGEVIFEILSDNDYQFKKDDLNALYAAISTDTGSFKYSNTSAVAMRIVAELIDRGLDVNFVNVALYQNKPFDQIKSLNLALSTLKLKFDEKVAIGYINNDLLRENDLYDPETDGIVEFFRDIKGVEVSIFLKESETNVYKVSLRSKYDFNVSKLAMRFGGGGHIKAAGCKLVGDINTVLFKLNEALREELENE